MKSKKQINPKTNQNKIEPPVGWSELAEVSPWPLVKPEDVNPGQHGWYNTENKQWLERLLFELTQSDTAPATMVEIGVWEGLTACSLLSKFKNLYYIGIDHFMGSPEHLKREDWKCRLPRLENTARANLWPFRDRAVILPFVSYAGMYTIYQNDVFPNVVYIDGGHDFDSVVNDIRSAMMFSSKTVICGDDAKWEGVNAALEFFEATGYQFIRDRNFWILLECGRPEKIRLNLERGY